MGRRSQHTPEELKELILGATRRVVEEEGIAQPSAREIARAIGYAPGTLYNMFQNLNEILLHVEARIFTELELRIVNAIAGSKGQEAVLRFAQAYAGFACDHPRLWALIIRHDPADAQQPPAWYHERAHAPVAILETALIEIMPNRTSEDIASTALLMWSALHGLIQVGMTTKFGPTARPEIGAMAARFADTFLMGLMQPTNDTSSLLARKEKPAAE